MLFYSEDKPSFVSISAVFLTQNLFMMILGTFLNLGSYQFDMFNVLEKFVDSDGTLPDSKRKENFKKECEDQM
jgi:hypothetical protein